MKAYLILANGKVFEGNRIGASGDVIGEVVFTTAMGGYMETLTDPSYYGQMVTQTFPLIGNYGSITADSENLKPRLSGYIVRELCGKGSNFRKETELNEFLVKNNVAGIENIDTRELTKIIRDNGVMNGMISATKLDLEEKLKKIKAFKVLKAVESTSLKEVKEEGNGNNRVALWDFGAKGKIAKELLKRDCTVVHVPFSYSAQQIKALNVKGIVLSNGGGDPNENTLAVTELSKLCDGNLPIFGICLGHQLLALANGAKVVKLKYGHRGVGQPVKDVITGRMFITSQNHGYAVAAKSLDESKAQVWFTNSNDKTCEGIKYKHIPAFSVQFLPEACCGPRDTGYLFDEFVSLIKKNKEDR